MKTFFMQSYFVFKEAKKALIITISIIEFTRGNLIE